MDRDTIRHLADLAKLRLTADDESRLQSELQQLLDHFALLQQAPTEGVPPSPQPFARPAPLRPDVAAEPLPADAVLGQAPEVRNGCFRVPRTVHG